MKIISSFLYLVFLIISVGILAGCGQRKNDVSPGTMKVEIGGSYVNADYKSKDMGYDWVAVIVNELTDSLLQISVRSRADLKKPTCTLDTRAFKIDSLGLYKSNVEGNSILFLFSGDSIVISEDPESSYSNLYYFCSGGGSIAGTYYKLAEPIDTAQIDKVIFRKSLNYDKYNFFIEVYGKELTIEPYGLAIDNQVVTNQLEGTVMDAEIGDLNIDGYPEVLVYIQSVGSGSYGSVMGWSVNNGKSMSQVWLPEITDDKKAADGYMGHDEFRIIENTLVRRFPIYKPADSNSNPTGGMRQLQYKLKDGEASRIFVIDRIVEY